MNDKYENDEKENKFLAMWCNLGLECVIDITEYEFPTKSDLATMIKTGDNSGFQKKQAELNRLISVMSMRARFNIDRSYEIYAFRSSDGITKKEIEDLFETNPQFIVDFIRENGVGIVKKNRDTQNQKIF
jgi:hypothetical protein